MTPSQLVGYSMAQTTAITSIVSTRIYNGLRPTGTVVPCINYFEMPGASVSRGLEVRAFTINCRAASAEAALSLARSVTSLFHGSSYMGVYGSVNGFDVSRCCVTRVQGLIPEPEDNIYNAPVDIQVAFVPSTVS